MEVEPEAANGISLTPVLPRDDLLALARSLLALPGSSQAQVWDCVHQVWGGRQQAAGQTRVLAYETGGLQG